MIVVIHQDVGVQSRPKLFRPGRQQLDEVLSIAVTAEDVALLVAPGGDMVSPTAYFDPQGSGHGDEQNGLLLQLSIFEI
jgi:hypothetical protein